MMSQWRIMKKVAREESRAHSMERINLRLPSEVLQAIDAERSRRAGNVSRNTWIAEAVAEKLKLREQGNGGA